MKNFKIGDIVLFSWKPKYGPWRKGKIVAIVENSCYDIETNNLKTHNPYNLDRKPEYYVSEVDDNNNIIDSRQLFAIDKNSEYILKFLPGMESMIGKNSYYTKSEHDIDKEKKLPEHDADEDYIRWKNQFKNVSKNDYLEIPGLKEMFDDEQKWKEKIEKKLDELDDKLNKLLLCQRTLPPETPSSPWYNTNKTYPWFDTSKVYCDNDLKNYKYVYTSNIAPEEAHNYKERYGPDIEECLKLGKQHCIEMMKEEDESLKEDYGNDKET